MSTTGRAYCPAHVSGLFAVHDEDPDPLRKGSRGAGWSLDKGATATLSCRAAGTRFSINGEYRPAPVTARALETLAPRQGLEVDLRLDLPVGQGFGMSAAGTVAACLAATDLFGLEPEEALAAAHGAEVLEGGGLGDAVGAWHGSAEIRIRPGCPPHGWAMRVEPPPGVEMLYVVWGDPIPTPSIIQDPAWKVRTRHAGDAAVDRILAAGRSEAWETLLRESHRFTQALGLLPEPLRAMAESLPAGTVWGQAMLGSTVWIAGDGATLDRAQAAASGAMCFRAGIDPHGARLLRRGS